MTHRETTNRNNVMGGGLAGAGKKSVEATSFIQDLSDLLDFVNVCLIPCMFGITLHLKNVTNSHFNGP